MKHVAHLLRIISLMILSMANMSLGCENQKRQDRLRIVIPIHIFIPNKDYYPKIGQDPDKDRRNKVSCELLGIKWPKADGSKLWHISLPMEIPGYCGDKRVELFELYIPIKYSYDPYAKNQDNDFPKCFIPPGSWLSNKLINSFVCPNRLPDAFVRSLVKDFTINYPLKKECIITHSTKHADFEFVLWNTPESLQKLGLIEEIGVIKLPVKVIEAPLVNTPVVSPKTTTDRKIERISVRETAKKSSLACAVFGSMIIITTGLGAAIWLIT